jgi:hypothetical protein
MEECDTPDTLSKPQTPATRFGTSLPYLTVDRAHTRSFAVAKGYCFSATNRIDVRIAGCRRAAPLHLPGRTPVGNEPVALLQATRSMRPDGLLLVFVVASSLKPGLLVARFRLLA